MHASVQTDDSALVAEVSRHIGNAIRHASIPDPLTDLVIKAYRQLGGDAVAVRSSATAEDLPEAAFAGQQETFLNVLGEQALLQAVRDCWASLWSERAVLYRARQNMDQASVKLAVVVQKMVQADVAGVMFTADPVSGARDELVIDASPGLGEAVVGGLATPDHFVVNKRRLRLKEQYRGRREIIVLSKAEGGIEQISNRWQPDGDSDHAADNARRDPDKVAAADLTIRHRHLRYYRHCTEFSSRQ